VPSLEDGFRATVESHYMYYVFVHKFPTSAQQATSADAFTLDRDMVCCSWLIG
jgi:hypothetical protein